MSGTGAAASYGDLLITSLVVLAAGCVAAFLAVRLLGRFMATGRVRGAHLLDVVARVPLEPRRSLYVVEVAGKTLLVGTSEMGLSVLTELDGDEVRARAVPRQSFADLVRAAWGRRATGNPGLGHVTQDAADAAPGSSGASMGHVAQDAAGSTTRHVARGSSGAAHVEAAAALSDPRELGSMGHVAHDRATREDA